MIFTSHEMWFLFSTISPVSIIGFRNPMLGLSAENISILSAQALDSLGSKNLVSLDETGGLEIHESISAHIDSIGNSTHSYMYTYKNNGDAKEKTKSIHYSPESVFMLEEMADNKYRVQRVDSKQQVISILMEPFIQYDFLDPTPEMFYAPMSVLIAIKEAADKNDFDAAKKNLWDVSNDVIEKQEIVNVFVNPDVQYSFMSFLNRSDIRKSVTKGFSVITSAQLLWFLEVVNEKKNIIGLSKISLQELENRIKLKTVDLTL